MHRDRERRRDWLAWSLWGVLGGCDAGGNTPPEVLEVSAFPTVVAVGESTRVTALTRDLDGDALGYQWSSPCEGVWEEVSLASARFTPTRPPTAGPGCGPCALALDVTDGRGGRARGEGSLCVRPDSLASSLPRITERFQSSSQVPQNGPVLLAVRAVDPRERALRFTWTATVGTLDEPRSSATTSQVSWNRPERPMEDPDALPSITVTVTNAVGLSTQAVFPLLRAGPE